MTKSSLVRSYLALLLCSFASSLSAATTDPLVQQSDLQYMGAFRLPGGDFGGSSFAYGGTAAAYNPANDSLYIVGHDHQQMVAEVKIPQIVNSSALAALKTATVLQPFSDASDGKMYSVKPGETIKIGGLLVYNGKLFGTAYVYYDATGSQINSHFSSQLSLQGGSQGMFRVGTVGAGFVSGYMASIPTDWQAAFGAPALTGNCCIPIVTRTSFGPAIFAFDPLKLGQADPTPAAPLVYYTASNPLAAWDSTGNLFNGTTQIHGVVFPNGTRSVLFFGTHGVGPFCYGTGGSSGGKCNDPADSDQGNHAYPYQSQIWAYDVNQLLATKNGQIQPWAVQPYGVWKFTPPFDKVKAGGVAYDSAAGRIFILMPRGDGELPIVLVYRVGQTSSSPPTAPAAPSNLGIK